MKSLEELQKIKERALERRRLSAEGMRARVVVAMGTCGIAAGARDTMTAILNELEQQQITDVAVTQTGCIGLCEFEPIVQVQLGEGEMVTYGKLTADRVPTLIARHVVGGEPIDDWTVKQKA
ncbi:MAG TPA: (2Fe-2S) ferredoxin domain-containing protein [Anaerolineae bacterium]|nr:(2Fe-2S) ferredoxin domain-containing protein [Anaerolineae bacterium]HOV48497.1 (2Fe-2S) ferredoxin domain-containing protein [Anaerolineae bacterium]HRT31085.1 (2Fe-2S) ferredoxin domain-containing protein [Anaerolineae bacterium]HRU93895.1 (2Fe-2S) ferredoxin domain-containing protein [Anaerolineae bacterium]HXK42830.1 (2Fe-2S) ferredoxin domain-containing protein [Anaerolineae bacterium]